jgi:tol-pal system protein YbgF
MTVGSSGGRWIALAMVAAAGAGTGCGGASEQCARPTQLKAELRRERHTIRNLENEIILLRAQLRDRAPVPLGPPPAEAVVASAPSPEAVASEPMSAGYADTPYGEVEVVYEGEAARESKVRPRIEIHETARVASRHSSEKDVTPVTAVPRPAVAPLPEIEGERLPVVPGRIPTVAEQLRRARAVTPEGGVVATIRPSTSLVPRAPGVGPRVITVPAPVGVADSAGPSAEDRAITGPLLPVATVSPSSDQDVEEVASAKSLYRRGKAAFRAGKEERAVRSLRSFLEHYPRHYLADNVQFYLAESFYRRDRHADALTEYNRLVVRYWRGNKLPDALLKIALCQLALGRHETGVASLRRLVSRFPQTRPARAARARLAELDRR